MQRKSKQFTISMPPEMAKSVMDDAKREGRTVSELMREGYRVYREKRIRGIFEEFQAEAKANNYYGYKPEDIVGLVKEVRAEMAAEREAKRVAKAG